MKVVLASESPARLKTLRAAGIEPAVIVSGVDEEAVEITDPVTLPLILATAKARAVVARARGLRARLVIGCDTVLDVGGVAYGKPRSAAEAVERWRAMRGSVGVLRTGHWLIDVESGDERGDTAATTVHFADVTDDEIAAYVATGEPLEVAGAFTIDGLGGAFVTSIEGDPHNVVGISLPMLRTIVGEFGIIWPQLWSAVPR